MMRVRGNSRSGPCPERVSRLDLRWPLGQTDEDGADFFVTCRVVALRQARERRRASLIFTPKRVEVENRLRELSAIEDIERISKLALVVETVPHEVANVLQVALLEIEGLPPPKELELAVDPMFGAG